MRFKSATHINRLQLSLLGFGKISHLFLKKKICGDGISEFLEDWQEDSVVERQVRVRVRVHQPACQGRVRAGQLALEPVCTKHIHGDSPKS